MVSYEFKKCKLRKLSLKFYLENNNTSSGGGFDGGDGDGSRGGGRGGGRGGSRGGGRGKSSNFDGNDSNTVKKRSCGLCGQPGHNRKNCPNLND
jgi:hypothetical protein